MVSHELLPAGMRRRIGARIPVLSFGISNNQAKKSAYALLCGITSDPASWWPQQQKVTVAHVTCHLRATV